MATSGQFLIGDLTNLTDSTAFDKADVEGSIAQRFSHQARMNCNVFAVRDLKDNISYQRLDALSNQIANRLLSEFGPQPQRVGLPLPLTIDAVAAYFGVWKAGKTCVPLDPTFPPARLAAVLADAHANVAIAAGPQFESIRDLNAVKRVLEFHSAAESMPEDTPRVAISAQDPAAIIYVSGSAGRPTGIVHSHRSLLHRCWSDTRYFQISRRDRVSLLTSSDFGAGIPQMLCALLNGASLCPFDMRRRSFEEIFDWLWSERISLFCPPAPVLKQFLESCPAGERFDDCRYVIQTGEPTLTTTIEAWREHFPPQCALVCQLAGTQTQVICRYSISHDQQFDARYAPVGYADCDKQLSIVDMDGHPVERGAIGELVVSSRYFSLGTWCADLARAIPHANSIASAKTNGIESMRTHDLVSLDARGQLRHHGRCDSSVNLRGNTVDFSEIEAALLEFDGVEKTVCVARELENRRRQLVAFYVPTDAANKPGDSDLRRWLRRSIPDYMLPARFLSVTELPRTMNGKLARRAVENLEVMQRSRGTDLHAFENELQRRFVEIWRETIGHEDIGIDDDFFDIGGDSLHALQVSAAISACIGRQVPVDRITELRNIRRLVAHLDRADEPITCISLLPSSVQKSARQPLFCIEGIYLYRQLAEALGPSRETIGVLATPHTHLLRTCSADGRQSGLPAGIWPPTVEQLAATYIDQIRRIQRSGPYRLAGAGFGGVIAFEMARRLTHGGEQVSLLGLIDSLAPRSVRPVSVQGWLAMAGARVRNSIPMSMPDSRAERSTREQHIEQSQAVAMMRYKPSAWTGNAVLFMSGGLTGSEGTAIAPNLGWDKLIAGQLSAHKIVRDGPGLLHAPATQDIAGMLRPFLHSRPW